MKKTRLEQLKEEISDRFSDNPAPKDPAAPKEPDPAPKEPAAPKEPDPAPKDPAAPKEPDPAPKEPAAPKEPDPAKLLDDPVVPDFTKRFETDPIQRESLAQQRAAENGRKLKQAEITLAEKEAEIVKLRDEITKKSTAPHMPREEEILAMPEISRIRESVSEDARSVALVQDSEISSNLILQKFGSYIGGWVEGGKDNPGEFRKTLREEFLTAYRASPDHDPDSEASLSAEHVKSVLSLVVRNESRVAEIQAKVEETINRAKEGVSSIGLEHWSEQATELKKSAFSVMDIPDDADPHSVAAFIKREISRSDEAKARFDDIVNAVTTVIIGPKVLSEKELKAVEASGVSLKDFNKRRTAKHLDNRRKLVAQMVQALYVVNQFPDLFRDAAELRESREAEQQLRGPGIKDRKAEPPVTEEKKAVTRETFVSAIEKFLT